MAVAIRWGVESEADVEDCVRLALSQLDSEPALQSFLFGFLEKPGRLLGPTEPQWPRFVLGTCTALGGDPAAAAWAAAAVEFSVTAIDVADDLADGDLADDREASLRAPGAAVALALLSQFCCLQAANEIGMQRAHRLGLLLATGSLASCAGQDLDMLLEDDTEVSEERAAAVSWRKSASLAAMAATAGAACATDSMEAIETAGCFGRHAGMVAQLVNDIAGIIRGERGTSGDILRRKKTLPVAYALSCARDEGIAELLDWYRCAEPTDHEQHKMVALKIRDLGALHYTWAVATIHANEARGAIRALESLTGRPTVRALHQLVPSLAPD